MRAEDDLLDVGIAADLAGLLRALEERRPGRGDRVAALAQLRRVRGDVAVRERSREAAIGGHVVDELGDPLGELGRRRRTIDARLAAGDDVSGAREDLPAGLTWTVAYDPTVFVEESIASVIETLIEAALLVVIVVILFLQTWRASVIPLLAVPVSIPLMLSTGPGSEIRRAMGVTCSPA